MNPSLPTPELATSHGRRDFLRRSGLAAFTAAMAPLALGSLGSIFNASSAQAATLTDADILNFALNLEYLEGEYYTKAVYGSGLEDNGIPITGTGRSGGTIYPVTEKVEFQDQRILQYATEIANDEIAHIEFIRGQLGSAAVAKPAIDLAGAFNASAKAAGISNTFDPYASDGAFLLGALTLTDVGVTAYIGSSALIQSKTVLGAAGGILAAESYHSATLRTALYRINYTDPTQFFGVALNKISDLRDSLDGPVDLDQGMTNPDGTSNIVPADGSSILFARSAAQVLNIVYSQAGATSGGFFPNGVNGTINAGTTTFNTGKAL